MSLNLKIILPDAPDYWILFTTYLTCWGVACLYLLDHSASSAGKFPYAIHLKGERFESTMETRSHLGTCSVLSWEEVQEPGNIFWFLTDQVMLRQTSCVMIYTVSTLPFFLSSFVRCLGVSWSPVVAFDHMALAQLWNKTGSVNDNGLLKIFNPLQGAFWAPQ